MRTALIDEWAADPEALLAGQSAGLVHELLPAVVIVRSAAEWAGEILTRLARTAAGGCG